jgi:hypothetical protein
MSSEKCVEVVGQQFIKNLQKFVEILSDIEASERSMASGLRLPS